MRKSLLATVAIAALITGTGMVAAESAKDRAPDRAGAAPAGHTEMNRGADTNHGAGVKGQAETNGSGAGEMKSDAKSKPSTTGAAANENRSDSSATGAGPMKTETKPDAKPDANTGAKSENKPDAKSQAQGAESPATKPSSAAQGSSPATTGQGAAGGRGEQVNLTSEQKTKIRTSVVESGGAPKMSRSQINFNINVGTVVPHSVHFVAVPETLIEVHPAWRGYRYFVVDDQIIIVEPRTFKIVAVLDV